MPRDVEGRFEGGGTSGRPPATEALWLACREKRCCHGARVVVGGRDLWRIATALEVAPWDFTRPILAEPGAADAFRLEPGGDAYQVVLARRGRTAARDAPCVFLWKLGDGHAQCGLGSLRPLACHARPIRPAAQLECLPGAGVPGCTCRPWPLLDPDRERGPALRETACREAAEYREVVDEWNRGLAPEPGRTYRDFCAHVMAAYGEME